MQKKYVWMLAAILTISGASVLTSCSSNDDNPAQPELNVAEKIIGISAASTVCSMWMPLMMRSQLNTG